MSAATSCYWCYRCSRYVRILAGGDLPVVCPECGSGFLLKFGHRQPRRNNDGDTGDRSQINLDGTERYCVVCQEALEFENEFNEVREMPCKHIYHSHCILQWLEQRNSCPLCWHELPMDSPAVGRFAGGGNRELPAVVYTELEGGRGRRRGGMRQFVGGLFFCFNN